MTKIPFLFGGTIRDNISLAHPGATLAEIIEAARLAGADEFIKKLSMGYESQIGEGGGDVVWRTATKNCDR